MSAWNPQSIFDRFFRPLYPADLFSSDGALDLTRARTEDANPANNPNILGAIADAAKIFSEMAVGVFGLDAPLDFSPESVHRVGRAITKERRDRWATMGEGPNNELANIVIHGTAYLGEVIAKHHGGRWHVRRPLWESRVFVKNAQGEGELGLFQWWLKSLSDDALDGNLGSSLGDRYRLYVENPSEEHDELPIIAPPDRRLPRLLKVRYDLLHKHLLAHLPEMRDLGRDFPSPERLEELRLKSLDFLLVGNGRMLVLSGLGENGLHIFWLDHKGFKKGAFVKCDAFPAPIVRLEGERITIDLSKDKESMRQEFLWWGP